MRVPDIYWPHGLAPEKLSDFRKFASKFVRKFVQMMANRLVVGVFRYDKGKPVRQAQYLTRLKAEIKAYEKSGNQEHLVNAANYCFLETVAPEQPDAHFEHVRKSITRDVLKMKYGQREGD